MMKSTSYLSNFNYQLSGPEHARQWIFLHGLMGYGLNWRRVVGSLPNERILTFDQRGHGRSWKPETGYAPHDYAEDLYRIVSELQWEKFILVGHSMGGRNALCFAHLHPQYVEKLVIEDIGPQSRPSAIAYYKSLLQLVPTPFASKLQAKEFFLNRWPQLQTGAENPLVLGQYLHSNIEEQSDGTADWRFSKAAVLASVVQGRTNDSWNEIRALQMPTLLVRGQNSKELTFQEYEQILSANSVIRGVEIPNAGHWVHSDQSQLFVTALVDFVDASD